MRRLAPLAAVVVLAVGCSDGVPGGKVVTPTPDTVIGTVPTAPTIKGDPAAGKTVFISTGCVACHTFKPAGTPPAKVGPDLDKLPQYAQAAKQGPLADFVKNSIVDPNAYVQPGFHPGVMPPNYGTTLKPQQLADLVAFLTQGS